MSLLKRGSVWWSYFYSGGIRYQESTGTSNRRQAESIEQKLKADANARRFQLIEMDPDITFGAVAARFVSSGLAHKHHLYHLSRYLISYFGDMPVGRITKATAERFRHDRMNAGRVIKDATVNRDLSVMRHILYWALDEKLIPANPFARMKMARERRTRRQVMSVAEEELLLGTAKGHIRQMTLMALDTGLRRGEITHQLWEDVDLERRLLFVTKSKTPEGESREIPLTTRLHELLAPMKRSQGLIFTWRDEPIHIVKTSWGKALKNAGLRHIRFHDLRHTFNTRLMEAGVVQDVRMALMGHSSGKSVHATYTHVELPVKRDAIAKLERWVQQQRPQTSQGESHAS